MDVKDKLYPGDKLSLFCRGCVFMCDMIGRQSSFETLQFRTIGNPGLDTLLYSAVL